MLLKGKKGGQVGAPKRKLKNLLLRTRKLEHLADENEIELESKENIKKWSSKSNPSKLAWLLRLKKGNQAGLSQAGGWGGALAPSVFGQTVHPISTKARGADYAHHSTTSPPDFQT